MPPHVVGRREVPCQSRSCGGRERRADSDSGLARRPKTDVGGQCESETAKMAGADEWRQPRGRSGRDACGMRKAERVRGWSGERKAGGASAQRRAHPLRAKAEGRGHALSTTSNSGGRARAYRPIRAHRPSAPTRSKGPTRAMRPATKPGPAIGRATKGRSTDCRPKSVGATREIRSRTSARHAK